MNRISYLLTDDELKKAQETYTHDFSEKGTTSTK